MAEKTGAEKERDPIISGYEELKKLYEKDPDLIEDLEDIVKEWLENKRAPSVALLASLMAIAGPNAGRLLGALLLSTKAEAVLILETLAKHDGESGLVRQLRLLVARYHHRVEVKRYSLAAPYRLVASNIFLVDKEEPIVRVEGVNVLGERIIVDLDREDLSRILEILEEENLLDKIIEEEEGEEGGKDKTGPKSSPRIPHMRSPASSRGVPDNLFR